ncbi:MAG: hypothetical protein OXG51_03060 [Gammaproteobacteria bacterium]|nr:hypothetical protein [Gammaproteobacteria bacterium]
MRTVSEAAPGVDSRIAVTYGDPWRLEGLLGMGLERWVVGNYRTTEAFLAEARHGFEAVRDDGESDSRSNA